jgi:Ca2+-binding EF-hand superfamily protein
MKKLFDLIIAFAVMAAGTALASAQDFPPPPQQGPPGGPRFQMPAFAELDKNKDKKLSRDELGQFPPQLFDRLDENKDGFIIEEEFNRTRNRGGGGAGGGTMNIGERFTRLVDTNEDNRVTREEFARILHVFDALDKDRSGDVNQEEMNRFFQAMDEVQNQDTAGVDVNAFFERVDKDKDGRITPGEMDNAATFKAMDSNKDNILTREELARGLRKLQEASKQKQVPP